MGSLLFIFLGFLLLVVGGEFLVRASVGLSFKLKISKMVIGLTVVSFATSAPELLVSLQAAFDGSSDSALANVIGSNIANIGLVLGITAIISSMAVDRDFYSFNGPIMIGFSLLLYFFLRVDNQLSALEGGVLLTGLVIYLIVLIRRAKKDQTVDGVDDALATSTYFRVILWLIIGAVALYFGSEWLVKGAKELASSLGVSDQIIFVTVVAIGTSVPELAASIMAALRKEKAISLGNLIGSNIFNIASVLGLTAIIKPLTPDDPAILSTNIFWMIGFAIILIPLAFISKKMQLGRVKGLFLFIAYILFIVLTIS